VQLRRASNNSLVSLGKELGRGGEGSVHLVHGSPDLVAKIYLKPVSQAKADKLRSMSSHASPVLLRAAAWPIDLLLDETLRVRGFLMPRVSAREDLHQLYSPKGRRRAFPAADFRFVVRAAANLARAFAQVHVLGNVIGDVNHGNALVGADATVLLIDCDSFQVRDSGRTFTCDVGVPLFTPPELQGQGFRGLKRTVNHDAFGLAVLVFHLLYLGRHPFAGKFADGEMPIERAIAESRFAYGANAGDLGMSAPPGTLPLSVFGAEIQDLFMRAFAPPSAAARPTPMQWIDALKRLEENLGSCPVAPDHHHPRDQECCWCRHELATGMRVFGRQIQEAVRSGANKVARLWDVITAVKKPEALQPAEVPEVYAHHKAFDALGPIPRGVLAGFLTIFGLLALKHPGGPSGFLALAYFGGAIGLYARKFLDMIAGRKRVNSGAGLLQARQRVAKLVEKWNRLAADNRFDKFREELEAARERLLEIPKQRDAGIKALAENAANRQRDHFLSMFMIEKAKLPHLQAQEIVMLASYGIDSADDVLRNANNLPKQISSMASAELRAWARECEQNFKFDPAAGANPADVREIEELYSLQQSQLLAVLSKGGNRLQSVANQMEEERTALTIELQKARETLKDRERDLA
jgi:DNA-binding helix-hairpin-helix protein with protein kinase domain